MRVHAWLYVDLLADLDDLTALAPWAGYFLALLGNFTGTLAARALDDDWHYL
jgi:hypothetical protein